MNFTPAQKLAIDTKNCSLLVSAGAGSGKTRVLTERIIDRLLDADNKTDITRFLIVTFTNAAAKELSDRIRLSLTSKVAGTAQNKNIIKNLALLPQAKISTIDSFCYDLVKDNYQRLGLLPKLRIAEETETDVVLGGIIEEIIEEKMSSENKSPYFLTVYELFSGKKKDEPFLKTMKDIYKYLLNLPSVGSYLDTCCERFKEVYETEEFFDTYFGKLLYNYAKEMAFSAVNGFENALEMSKKDAETYKKFVPVIENDIDGIKILSASLEGGFSDALYCLSVLKHKTCRTDSFNDPILATQVYSLVKNCRERIKKLKDTYFLANADTLKLCAEDCYNIMDEIRDIMLKIDERFSESKKTHGILTFSDVERMALTLLYDDIEKGKISDIAKNIADEFDELYIDEYQDINPVQDMIFKAVAKNAPDGCENNRFLVGDVKQSIYGFRGARPEIFNAYREKFDNVENENSPQRKIFMQNNFRCSENVIAFTNMLFEFIMPESYSKNDKLIFSKKEEIKITEPVKLLICNCDTAQENTAEVRLQAQAQMLVNELMYLVDNQNVRSSQGKKYDFSDVAILTQTWNAAIFLENYLNEKGIPVVCEKGENFFTRREIRLALNIIKSVDNPERDIATAGFMRSAAGLFNDDELTKIRLLHKDGSLFSAVRRYEGSEKSEPDLCAKIRRFLELHTELRKISRTCSAADFIRKMYAKTDLVSICTSDTFSAVGRKASGVAKKNLMRLYDMAREYDKTIFKGISCFIEYLSAKCAGNSTKSESVCSDGVRIMTIHKSKGLEFPVCFVFEADRELKVRSEKIVMNDLAGAAFKISSMDSMKSVGGKRGYVSINTPFKDLVTMCNKKTEYLEDKRLLYVALTRAIDRLYITACPKYCGKLISESNENPDLAVSDGKSALHWMFSYIARENKLQNLVDKSKTELCDDNGNTVFEATLFNLGNIEFSEEKQVSEEEIMYECDNAFLETIKTAIHKADRVKEIVSVPPKLTVTLLKHGLIDYEDTANSADMQRKLKDMPDFVKESGQASAAEKGTAMHTFLQFANYLSCAQDGCENEANRLAENGFITRKQRELLDIQKLDAFFKTSLYYKIKNAKRVYREMRFNLKVEAKEVIADVPETDDFVLVQGVIDCFIENDDGTYTVIDFKTDSVPEKDGAQILHNKYFNQLSFYCRAVEDITKKKVSGAVIFSFTLMDCVPIEYETRVK